MKAALTEQSVAGTPPEVRVLPFQPPLSLRSPHLQTIAASSALRRVLVERRAHGLRRHARSQLLECADGVRLEALVSEHGDDPSRPLVVGLHGWHGCADSLYMLSVGATLFDAGFDVARVHFRDHGGTHGLNEDIFHSCRLQEVVDAIVALQARNPARPLLLMGFSLGGNFALRVAREAPAAGLELARVLAVCPVLDPATTMDALDYGWFVYRFYFMQRWRRSMEEKARHFPERYNFSRTRDIRGLGPMTDWFVRHHTDFAHSQEYLDGYSITGDHLAGLQVPSRIIAALDDPVIPSAGLRALASPSALQVDATRYGGHCGFIADHRLRSWLDAEVLRDFDRWRPSSGA